ncbi:MAG TPA: L-2-amino-thiazoline-4-carboxylic acid hydrolase [Mucilaginibacter sp.]|nr:L-2-amino-thiazoline-4-carboxylic acid hydrolase [Mucilaginibacter sp.]
MSAWLLLTIIFIALAVIVILKKSKAKTAYKHFFKKAIKGHFPGNPDALINEVEELFAGLSKDTQFASRSSNPVDRRLDFCAYFLALIKVLENRGLSFEQIRSICLEITIDYVSPKNTMQKWLKRLPARLIGLRITKPLLNLFSKKVSIKGHPDGFRAVILTDKTETYDLGYGIDILECGICKLFQKHDAGKYAAILCEVDKVTSGLAGLELIRTGTIANGAAKCDFRFKKINTD